MSSPYISQREAYKLMLKDYPDVLNIDQMCEILSVSTKTGYKIIKSGSICCLRREKHSCL